MNVFDQLRSGLLTWRRIGHGLWPIRDWPDSVIKNYVSTLGARCGDCPAQPAIFRVANGRDLLVLIRYVLNLLRRTDECDADDPVVLMETILFALIGLVYPEEPGERTIEDLLMDF